ncbi:MAG: hypothetical protein IJ555_03135 [Ruminococcus sp.]|nr:hypothetical protein [Ruminococcus sp.]
MRITIYQNGEVSVLDKLIGFVGETNHRTMTFVFDNVTGADTYSLRLLYPDGTAYTAPIVNKELTVTGSMLPQAGRIRGQWVAYATNNDDEYTVVAKSQIFELIIGESIGDDVEPVPTYEASVAAAEALVEQGMTKEQMITAITQIVESGSVGDIDTGFVTTLKEILHNTGFRIGVDTTAALQALADAGLMEDNVLYIPSDGDTGWQELELLNGWETHTFEGSDDSTPQTPQYRRIGNHVYVRGTMHNESISTTMLPKVYAQLPVGCRATRHVFRSTTGSGLTVSRIETNPSGELFTRCVFDLESGERQSSCVWMSIDMDFLID